MTNQAELPKRRRNGQYSHGFDVLCVCGATKGAHNAEYPYAAHDEFMPGYVRDCDRFKKAKVQPGA